MTTDIAAVPSAATLSTPSRSKIQFTATHAFGLGPVTGTWVVRNGTIIVTTGPAGCAVSARLDTANLATTARAAAATRASGKRFLDIQE